MSTKLQQLIRWACFALACFLLYQQVLVPQDTQLKTQDLLKAFQGPQLWPLLFIMILVPVNWGIEAVKWKYLIQRIQAISLLRAFSAVLVGTGLGLFTPNRTGEFLGRVLFVNPSNRVQAAFATGLGSLSQLVVTIVIGTLGLGVYLLLGLPSPLKGQFVNQLLIVLSFSAGLIALVVYLLPGILKRTIELIPFLNRWKTQAEILVAYKRKELIAVLLMSFLRYLVFWFQFVVAVWLFQNSLEFLSITVTIAVIYLLTTLVPTVVLTELGVRGAVAISLFVPMGALPRNILLATFTIWVVNLLLPAAFGAILFLFARIKWKRSKQ